MTRPSIPAAVPDYFKFATEQIKAAREDLARDNLRAKTAEWYRFTHALDSAIDAEGFYNVVATVADAARNREYHSPEGSAAEADWKSAADQLDALKLDLKYK